MDNQWQLSVIALLGVGLYLLVGRNRQNEMLPWRKKKPFSRAYFNNVIRPQWD